MSKGKSSAARQLKAFLFPDRENMGWAVIWGIVAAVAAFAVLLFLRYGSPLILGGAVAPFLYETQYGYSYVYVFTAMFVAALAATVRRKTFLFDEIHSNRNYYLTRMGYSSVDLVSSRLLSKILSVSLSYFFGAACGLALCAVFQIDFTLNGIISLAFFGYTGVVLISLISIAAALLAKKRVGAVIGTLVCVAVLAFYFKTAGVFTVTTRYEMSKKIASLMYLDGVSYLLIAGVLCVLMVIVIFFSARDRSAFYNVGAPKKAVLARMGIEKDAMVAMPYGRQTETIAVGETVRSKKEQHSRETAMITLGTGQLNVPRAAKPKEPMSAGRIVLASVLLLLCLVCYASVAVSISASKAEIGAPASGLGYYAVRVSRTEALPGYEAGELAPFVSCAATDVSEGSYALAESGSQLVYGEYRLYLGVHQLSLNGSWSDVDSSRIKAQLVETGVIALIFGFFASPEICVSVAVLLTGCLLLALIVRKKHGERQPQ